MTIFTCDCVYRVSSLLSSVNRPCSRQWVIRSEPIPISIDSTDFSLFTQLTECLTILAIVIDQGPIIQLAHANEMIKDIVDTSTFRSLTLVAINNHYSTNGSVQLSVVLEEIYDDTRPCHARWPRRTQFGIIGWLSKLVEWYICSMCGSARGTRFQS